MVIDVKNVTVQYTVSNFREIGLKEYLIKKVKREIKTEHFTAVDNVSFSLEEGDFLGIIGTNGAGKSTLLKVISGIMKPAKGSVTVNGKIAALLELGSGFDGDLTLNENIYLRGAMLGYTKEFVTEKYKEILEYAELTEFENRAFKQLSSGMKSRLAFAISCLMEPEILILDEVLSVGDAAFRAKSEATMMNISDTRDCAFEAFITNLGKYNEGFLVGEWVKFPVTNEEMQAVFRRIGIGRRYEEWFITDYDCPDAAIGKMLGEYESLSELNYLAGQIMALRESDDFWQAVLDLGENTGSVQELINLTENLDCFDYLPGVQNDYDLGYYWIEESGCYDTSNLGALANYIDYESFGRDIRYEEGGVFGDNGYVRSNGGRFVDIYDGDIENIPDEYRVSSPALPVRSAVTRQTEQPER